MSSSPYQSSDSYMDPNDLQSWWYPQADGNYQETLDPVSTDGVHDVTSRMDTPVFGRDGFELQPTEPKTVQLSEIECGHHLEKSESYEEPRNQLGRGSLDSSQTPILHPSYEPSGNKRTRTQKGPQKRRRPSDVTSSTQNTQFKTSHSDDQLPFSSARKQSSHSDQHLSPHGGAKRSTRSNFSKDQVSVMRSWYRDHSSDPYLSPIQKQELADQTGLEIGQISSWFINKRRRSKSGPRSCQPPASFPSSTTFTRSELSGGPPNLTDSEFGDVSQNGAFSNDTRNDTDFPIFNQGLRSRESSYSSERWMSTSPKDDSAPMSTITNLQNDDRPPTFHQRTIIGSESNAVLTDIANSRRRISLEGAVNSIDPQVSSLGNDNERRRTGKKGKHIYQSEHPPERQGNKKFQCTYCKKGFDSRDSWKRHEKSSCAPQVQYICMDGGPLLSDNDGHLKCAFCGLRDPPNQHMDKEHNTSTCLQVDKKQVFSRHDGACRHMRDVHNASPRALWPTSWIVRVNRHDSELNRWCGFCKSVLQIREDRFKHVANHYEDTTTQYDMTRWTRYVPGFTEDVLKSSQTGYGDIYFPDIS